MAEGGVGNPIPQQPEKLQHLLAAYAVRQLQEKVGEGLDSLPLPDLRSCRYLQVFQRDVRDWIKWTYEWLRVIRSAVRETQEGQSVDLETVELNIWRFDSWLAAIEPYSTTFGLRKIQHHPSCRIKYCNKFGCGFRTVSDEHSVLVYPDWILVHRSHSGRIRHIDHMDFNYHRKEDWEA